MRPTAVLHRPEDIADLLGLLEEHGDDAKVVAGGTAFTILWRAGLISTGHLVSATGVGGLADVQADEQGLSIGALARLRDVERAAPTLAAAPVLAAALRLVANVRVRNVATMGGNVSEADYTSDPPAVLAALDATVTLSSSHGSRDLPLSDFLVDYFETALRPEELVTRVRVPRLPAGWSGTYLKLLSRSAEDRTCLGVAAFVTRDDSGACGGLRVAVVGANPVPLRLPAAEAELLGSDLGPAAVADLAAQYVAGSDPVSDVRGSSSYRKRVLGPLVERAVRRAAWGHNDAVFA